MEEASSKPSFDPSIPDYLNTYTHGVIGAAIEVHRHLGPALLKSAYEQALVHELALRQIRCARRVECPVDYKGEQVARAKLDLLVEDELVVAIEAIESILTIHKARVRSQLRAGGFRLGLLINFQVPALHQGVTRILWRPGRDSVS